MSLSKEQRILQARLGGLTLAAKHDPREYVRPAKAAFDARWERLADPEGVLPPEERQRRADALKRAHFVRLALRSSMKRQGAS